MVKYANQKKMEQHQKNYCHRIVFPGKLSFKNEEKWRLG